jgi:hypothetical protein
VLGNTFSLIGKGIVIHRRNMKRNRTLFTIENSISRRNIVVDIQRRFAIVACHTPLWIERNIHVRTDGSIYIYLSLSPQKIIFHGVLYYAMINASSQNLFF